MEFARPVDSNAEGAPPSVFDLMAQANLEKLLPSLFGSTGSINQSFLLQAGKAVLDVAMLAKFGGIASEVIYGLERRCTHNKTWILYAITLTECHIIPLLRTRFARIPAVLQRSLQILNAIVKILYISGDCRSFSLLHWLGGVFLRHSTTDIYERTDLASRGLKWLLVGSQLALFLFQSGVFDRLYKSPASIAQQTAFMPSVPPNLALCLPKPHPNGLQLPPKSSGVCPACLESWREPMAVSTGVIYCRSCIEGKAKCLVTLLPITHFIPLFLQ